MAENIKLKEYFGKNLAELLAEKIQPVYKSFPKKEFIHIVGKKYKPLELKDRVKLISDSLKIFLPKKYPEAIEILLQIMGEPNPNETGMFTNYYWLMPVGKFIEDNGLEHFEISMQAIYELTQRNTGEYTVRPFINRYPGKSLECFHNWSLDKSFHVRRLASEGLRPKLPWAAKLEIFIENYKPVFEILDNLKKDKIKFVKKSVANNLNDYLKVNYKPTIALLNKWEKLANTDTKWVVKHAKRNL